MNNFTERKYIQMQSNYCQIIHEVEHKIKRQNKILLTNSKIKIRLVKN